MKITWYGTASILLETNKASVLFDPYMKDLPQGRESREASEKRRSDFAKQNSILITHGHFDHLSSITSIYGELPCKVYLTELPHKTLQKQNFPEEKMNVIKPGDELRFDDITVRVLAGKHIKFIKMDFVKASFKKGSSKNLPEALRLSKKYFKYPGNKECLFYEIEAEGKLVQLMGSASLCDGVEYRTGADALILPHQGRSDIDENNKRLVDILKPKRILLDHYDDSFPPFSRDVPTEDFCREISKTIPTEKLIEMQATEI